MGSTMGLSVITSNKEFLEFSLEGGNECTTIVLAPKGMRLMLSGYRIVILFV